MYIVVVVALVERMGWIIIMYIVIDTLMGKGPNPHPDWPQTPLIHQTGVMGNESID